MVPTTSLIWRQRWKLYSGFAGLAISGIAMTFDRAIAGWLSVSEYTPTLVGTLVFLISFLWLALGIRCAQCGLGVFWHAVSSKNKDLWLSWLLDAEKCPRCSH